MLRLAASVLVTLAFGASAHAQAPVEFYRGKQIKIIVGSAPGGGDGVVEPRRHGRAHFPVADGREERHGAVAFVPLLGEDQE